MLNTNKLAGQGVIDYLRAAEYYRSADDQDVPPMHWIGQGLAAIGMQHGQVAQDSDLVNVCRGFTPQGAAMVQNAGEDDRVIGIDWTFTADKSMSALMAVETPERRDAIIRAHQVAVRKAIGFVEQFAEVRTGSKGASVERPAGIIAAEVLHFSNRNLDENLHSHVLVMNVAPTVDGRTVALETEWMLKHHAAASALYRAECAHQMQQLGYGVTQIRALEDSQELQREKGHVYWSVTGFGDNWRTPLSTRREEILTYQAENGGTKDQASLATRQNKDEPPFAECLEAWKQRHEDLLAQGIAKPVEQLRGLENVLDIPDDKAMLALFDDSTNAVQRRGDLLARVAMENVGRLTFDQCIAETDRLIETMIERGEMHRNTPVKGLDYRKESGVYNETRLSTDREVFREQDSVRRALARQDDQSVRVPTPTVDKAIADFAEQAGFALSEEQQNALRHVCERTGGTAQIIGDAGTGKTTLMKAAVQAFGANGQEVMGVCIAWDAAKKFEAETGAPSTSAAQFMTDLKNDRLQLKPNTVVVLDEAAMAGSKTIHAVMAAVDKAGGKTILMGDHKQLQPIEAGGTFRLVGSAIGSARLSDIRRQKSEQDLATAKAFYKDARQAYERMEKAGQVSEHTDSKAAITAMVGDYIRSSSPLNERLVLVGTHKEARTVSDHIRAAMKESGTIRGKEHTFRCKTGRWEEPIQLACGDRIRFTKKHKDLAVFNGTKATVERIDGTTVHCKLESDIASQNGRRVSFDIAKVNTVNYDWAVTVHKSQGQSKAEVFQLANPQMADFHSSMVGFTRMKNHFHLYGATDDIATFKRRVGVERLKENAVDSLITSPDRKERTPKQQVVDLIARVKAAFRPAPQQQPEPTQQKVRQRGQEMER